MECKYSYSVELKHANKIFRDTVRIFKDAVSFCILAFESEWLNLKNLNANNKINYADHLIHTTAKNMAKYPEFDNKFYKLPSYLRRNVVSTTLGHLSSYHSNLDKWYANSCKTSKPTLQVHPNLCPSFYRDGVYKYEHIDDDIISLKLYVNHDWVFVPFKLKHTDMQYIRRHCDMSKMSAPTLEKHHKKWFLRFCFEENIMLTKRCNTVLAVDLGINTDATCSVMSKDGTVLSRKFIDFKSEKDHLYHTLNKIRKTSRLHGSANTKKLWRHAAYYNQELARKVAKAITDYAVEMHVNVIVFEYLDIHKKKRGKAKQKLHMWRKNTIQQLVTEKAHRNGIRISRVCAYFTSKLAYDGSGPVLRGRDAGFFTYELCRFQNNKIYNCDLSASYNIGARFFIREYQKSISVKKWSRVVAKVPDLVKRTLCTYKTYLDILSLNTSC